MLAALLATSIAFPVAAQVTAAPADRQTIEKELQDLLETRQNLARQMGDFDSRIGALEAQLHGVPPKTTPPPTPPTAPTQPTAPTVSAANAPPAAPAAGATQVTANETSAPEAANFLKPKTWGSIEPGRGFVLART